MTDVVDHYRTLGVARNATAAQIKTRFHALAKETHPDATGNDKAKEELFKQLNEAYQVLSEPDARKAYDQALAAAESARVERQRVRPRPRAAAPPPPPPPIRRPPTPAASGLPPRRPAPGTAPSSPQAPPPGEGWVASAIKIGAVVAGGAIAWNALFGDKSSTWDSTVGRRRGRYGRFTRSRRRDRRRGRRRP